MFALKPPGKWFYFGRVIDIDARPLRVVGNGVLIYIYRVPARDKTAPAELRPEELLIPPLMTNRLSWSRGYFETIETRPLREVDRLPVHCFRDSSGRYWDEKGQRLERAFEPVGEAGLQSFRTIDDALSDALDLPRAPD